MLRSKLVRNGSVGVLLLVGTSMLPAPTVQAADFIRGDFNADSVVNISDAVMILNFLFLGLSNPPECLAAADNDADAVINITDPIYLLQFLFLGGLAPRRRIQRADALNPRAALAAQAAAAWRFIRPVSCAMGPVMRPAMLSGCRKFRQLISVI